MTEPIAMLTINLGDNPLTGAQVSDVVEKTAKDRDLEFIQNRLLRDNGLAAELGIYSDYPYEQVRIVPGLGDESNLFYREQTYKTIRVQSHRWPGAAFAVGFTDKKVFEAVRSMAASLEFAIENRRR